MFHVRQRLPACAMLLPRPLAILTILAISLSYAAPRRKDNANNTQLVCGAVSHIVLAGKPNASAVTPDSP